MLKETGGRWKSGGKQRKVAGILTEDDCLWIDKKVKVGGPAIFGIKIR